MVVLVGAAGVVVDLLDDVFPRLRRTLLPSSPLLYLRVYFSFILDFLVLSHFVFRASIVSADF